MKLASERKNNFENAKLSLSRYTIWANQEELIQLVDIIESSGIIGTNEIAANIDDNILSSLIYPNLLFIESDIDFDKYIKNIEEIELKAHENMANDIIAELDRLMNKLWPKVRRNRETIKDCRLILNPYILINKQTEKLLQEKNVNL